MSHPREPFERLLDCFDEYCEQLAKQEKFVFDRAFGKTERNLRLQNDPLERGVFLYYKKHWMQSDPNDPEVVLSYGAWFSPMPGQFPVHHLSKVFYEGKLSGIRKRFESDLKLAISEIKLVTQEQVVREGKVFKEWPKEGKK